MRVTSKYLFQSIIIISLVIFPFSNFANAVVPLPEVQSSTHPLSSEWYSNSSAEFRWILPSNIEGVSYLITEKPSSNPGSRSDGIKSSVTFENLDDGSNYFHIKFRQAGVWGPIAHYQFNIDTQAPAGFPVYVVEYEDLDPEVVFATTDSLSGVSHYEVKVGEGNWVKLSDEESSKPYRPSFAEEGTYPVYVKAVDRAGNETIASASAIVVRSGPWHTTIGWLTKSFDAIVDAFGNYSLAFIFAIAFIGIVALLLEGAGIGINKTWRLASQRRAVKKQARKAQAAMVGLVEDLKNEIKILNSLSKKRPLTTEEKFLKIKLQRYLTGLKNGRRVVKV